MMFNLFKAKKRYIVQWRYDQLKMWFWGAPKPHSACGYTFRRKKAALNFAFRMLSRNTNNGPWRIVEWNKEDDTYVIIFESSIDRVPVTEYNLKNFTAEEVKAYHLPPIVIDGKKRRNK